MPGTQDPRHDAPASPGGTELDLPELESSAIPPRSLEKSAKHDSTDEAKREKPPASEQVTTTSPSGEQSSNASTSATPGVDEGFQLEESFSAGSPPYGILPVWVVIILSSFVIYRFGKLRVAERVKRWLPMGHVFLWGVGVVLSSVLLVRTGSLSWILCGATVFLSLIFLNGSWLKSILAGVALTLEHHLEVGDAIRLDGLEGDLVHFGLRSTRLRAVDGTLHDIPHEHLLTQRVANLSGDGSDSACKIGVRVPEGFDLDDVMSKALEVAVLSPLASPRHKPEVFLEAAHRGESGGRGGSTIYIRGYAFDPNYQEHFKSDVLKRLDQIFDEARQG